MAEKKLGDSAGGAMTAAPKQQTSNSTPVLTKEKKVESKADKFRRLANRRVPRAIKCINAITNLGNASQYEYTDEQTQKIADAIMHAVKEMANAFAGKKQASNEWRL